MRKSIGSFLISLVVMISLIAGTAVPVWAAEMERSIETKTETNGDWETVTTTTTETEGRSVSVEVSTYIKNRVTKETIRQGETTYTNPTDGIKVQSQTEKKQENGEEKSTGWLQGTYNMAVFINTVNEPGLTMELSKNNVDRLIGSMNAIKGSLPFKPELSMVMALTAELPEIKTFTLNIPKPILRQIYEYENCALKIGTLYGSATFDNKAVKQLLSGSSDNTVITLTNTSEGEQRGLRVSANSGKQIFSFDDGSARIGLPYHGGYGLDPGRIQMKYMGSGNQEQLLEDGIAYDGETHEIVFEDERLGEYTVNIKPVRFSDAEKHWAGEAILRWSDRGIIAGYEGSFRPNAAIKRGDMAVILSRLMNYPKASAASFADLKGTEYYAEAISNANKAGVISGSGNQVRPQDNITREEAAVMLCKAYGIAPEETCRVQFGDESKISSWAKKYVNALVNRNVLSGRNGEMKPKAPITRAEIVTIMDHLTAKIVNYGTYNKNVTGNLLVNGGDTKLKGMVVTGDLLIGSGVAEKDVVLEDVTVQGKVLICGGGSSSVHLNGKSSLGEVQVNKQTGAIRIVSEKTVEIKAFRITGGNDQVILQGDLQTVSLESETPLKLQKLNLNTLKVSGAAAKITVDSSSHVKTAEIAESARKATFDISGEVNAIQANAEGVLIQGTGLVDTVTAGANDVEVKTSGTEVKAKAGVTGTIAGKTAVEAGSTATVPGSKPSVSSDGKVSESVSAFAPTIRTNLEDGKTVKGKKLNFDLFATTTSGEKIPASNCKVTVNGKEVSSTWDDSDKTGYTLILAEGKNTIVITAQDNGETAKKEYTITYKPGTMDAVVAVELFSLGKGYLIEPVKVSFAEDDNAAQVLTSLLSSKGYGWTNTGKIEKSFYLATVTGVKDKAPETLDEAPEYIKKHLNANGFSKAEDDWQRVYADEDALGEFDYTHGAGWMYSVNNSFPNLGLSQYYLQDGDVMRVQFTLAYGADIGGSGSMGGGGYGNDFYPVANRDEITKKYAGKNISSILSVMQKLDASQVDIDKL